PWGEEERTAVMPLAAAEMIVAHAEHFPAKADRYGRRLRETLSARTQLDASTVVRGYQARERFKGRVLTVFRSLELLLTPGLGKLLPTWEEIEACADDFANLSRTLLRFTSPFNVAGVPTISLPGGFTDEGLPIGIQLAAPPLAESALIRA